MSNWLTSLIGKMSGKGSKDTPEPQKPAKIKVVIVDDNPITLKLIRSILQQREKYLIRSAPDGKKGLELIQKEKPALVITDIMMPEVDGLSLLRELRKQPETQSLPVILLTAKGSGEDIKEGYREGADYYMTKPFTEAQLVRGVNLMLAHSDEKAPKVWKID